MTSTKLDELDVQRRLDVRLLTPSENETGWDVFILDYNVDGPIGTVSNKFFYLLSNVWQNLCKKTNTYNNNLSFLFYA